jgi:nicotinamide-nucleotide adenylyltransferase
MPTPAVIYSGRFQPFHVGHLSVIEAILDQFNSELIIGIVLFEPEVTGSDPLLERSHPVNNPFSFWEIQQMIKNTISEEGLSAQHTISILPVPQLDRWWSLTKRMLPAQRTWVFPVDEGTPHRTVDVSVFEKHGEECVFVPAPSRVATATAIRHRLAVGENWRTVVPLGTARVLEELDGEKRLRDLYSKYGVRLRESDL